MITPILDLLLPINGKRTVQCTHPNDAHIIAYNRTAATVFMHYRLSLVSSILYLICCATVTYATALHRCPGMFVTVGGAALVRATGSWLPLFLGVSGLQVLSAAYFGAVARISPPPTLLLAQEAAANNKKDL